MTVEQSALRRATWRLVPFLIACYFLAYLDRINVSVAALQMNRDLGLSAAAFGLGAGLFFLTYFLFEVPSNLVMQRVGPRRWIFRIMLTWGLVSGATAFVQSDVAFYALRLLLGAAEAGFFPAVLFYLSQWFPQERRARVFSYFLAALPLTGVVGTPLSGALLGLDGLGGFHGWQWMFLIEAVPTVLLAPLVLRCLPDRPQDARWLPEAERAWLVDRLAAESASAQRAPLRTVLADRRVGLLSLVHLCGNLAIYGLAFFLPQLVATLGVSDLTAASLAALPYLAGALGMLWFARRTGASRAWLPFAVSAVGFACAALGGGPVLWMLALGVAAFGCFGYAPGFWAVPTSFLGGTSLAVAIAVVNSIGNLGGFLGPYTVGALRASTGSFAAGLLLSAALMALAAVLVAARLRSRSSAPDPEVLS
jgi:MFS transporter, ACS family, tartrate transporter